MEKWLNLKEIFDLDSWENLQDALSDVTKMAILMVNYKGEPITKHSGCHAFCDKLRHDDTMKKYCQKCDARAGFEAMQDNEPFIYKCYFGIVDIAIPIIVNDKYIGAIMAGQIRIGEDGDHLEQILHVSAMEKLDSKRKELQEDYYNLPYLSFGRIRVIANLLYYLCNYMSLEGAKKEKILQMYETVLEGNLQPAEYDDAIREGIRMGRFESEQSFEEQELECYLPDGCSDVIKEALQFVFAHPEKMYTLIEVAQHCHVSTGYLSRLFSKQLGESYSKFIPKVKVDWSKRMLKEDDYTISEIADRLGFNETGYFIKIFKKQTGVTPLVYKKYHKMK